MQAVPTLIAAAHEFRLRVRPATATVALILVGLMAMLQIVGAAAQQSIQDSPDGFVATLRADVLAASAPGRRSDAVRADLQGLIAEAFDLPAIAAAALRSAGEAATAAQHGRLGRALGLRMTEEILRRRNSADAGFQVAAVRPITADEWLVTTRVTPPGEAAIIIGWRVRRIAGRFRIVDVTRDGVSIVITQRQEIASALRAQRSLDTVIDDIERRAAAATERP